MVSVLSAQSSRCTLISHIMQKIFRNNLELQSW